MRHQLLAATAIVLASPAFAQDVPPLTEAERAQAIQEIQDMRARISAIESKLGISPPPAAQYTPAAPRPPRDHNLELYGFVQLDAIQDFKRVNPDWDATLRPSRIPTEKGQFGGNGQSVFSVRQSRLGAKATGTLAGKPYEAKFEFDLFGTGVDAGQTTFRVRHMYAKWGPFLAGQTNTLFMDGDIFPNVLDYWGPTGMVFVRTPQIRWTFLDRDGWTAAVALEHPSDDIDPGNIRLIDENVAANIQSNEELPDLTAAVRYGGSWGHVRLAGMLRRIGYDTRGTETAMCTRRLNNVPIRVGPLFHQYICVPDGKGGKTCGGLGPSGSMRDSPGKVEYESSDSQSKSQCKKVADDDKCLEDCIQKKFREGPPNYSVDLSHGDNCQTWADRAFITCQAECRGKK